MALAALFASWAFQAFDIPTLLLLLLLRELVERKHGLSWLRCVRTFLYTHSALQCFLIYDLLSALRSPPRVFSLRAPPFRSLWLRPRSPLTHRIASLSHFQCEAKREKDGSAKRRVCLLCLLAIACANSLLSSSPNVLGKPPEICLRISHGPSDPDGKVESTASPSPQATTTINHRRYLPLCSALLPRSESM